jgi:NADH-quinone oxidoreductase subunit A
LLYDSPALELQAYIPLGVSVILATAFCGLFVTLAVLIGPKRLSNPVKFQPFECGSEPIGSPRARYSVRFYQVAILFLVFDIETAFMYPWAVLYSDLSTTGMPGMPGAGVGLFGLVEMLTFVIVLIVALAYVWRKKAIGWD